MPPSGSCDRFLCDFGTLCLRDCARQCPCFPAAISLIPDWVHRTWETVHEDAGDVKWDAWVVWNICKALCNLALSAFSLFLLWLIFFRPYAVRPHVDAASLATFDLAGHASILRYDLALNVTFFNDHRTFRIHFDHLTAGLYFNGTKLGPSDDTLPSFNLKARRHRKVYPLLRGQASNVSAAVVEEFARQRAQGTFTVDVRVKTTLTYKFFPTRTVYYHVYDCWLHFPPPANNGTPAVTGRVKCHK